MKALAALPEPVPTSLPGTPHLPFRSLPSNGELNRKFFSRDENHNWWREFHGGVEPGPPYVDFAKQLDSLGPQELGATLEPWELFRLALGYPYTSQLADHLEAAYEVVSKIHSCMYRYGYRQEYWRVVRALRGIRRLHPDRGEEDFSFRLTWTPWSQAYSWSRHATDRPLYLDGAFGLLVYYRGKHVLTVGFSFSPTAVLVAQVQLREKKGNRWLYRLNGSHYLDWILGHLHRAFYDQGLELVTGDSAVEGVEKSYGSPVPHLTPEQASRIRSLYDRPLAHFRRAAPGEPHFHRQYTRLHRNP